MNTLQNLRPLFRDLVRFNRSQITFVTPIRNAIGVVLPLAVGIAVGQVLPGVTTSTGALNAAFSDRPGPYPLRLSRILLAGLVGALSVFVGSVTGRIDWLTVVLVTIWGLGAGLLSALGPAPLQIGLTGVILLLVYGTYPAPPERAAIQGGLVLVGAAFQGLLAVAAWPVRPFAPERQALATVFRQLAAYVANPPEPGTTIPVTTEITTAGTMLSGFGTMHGRAGEALRVLLDEAERIRLELIALQRLQGGIAQDDGDETIRNALAIIWESTGTLLTDIATMLTTPRADDGGDAAMERIENATRSIRQQVEAVHDDLAGRYRTEVLTHVEALAGELRAAIEIASQGETEGQEESEVSAGTLLQYFGNSLDALRANLTLRSAYFRHAIRLAACLAVATALARGIGVPRPYWVALTAAIVLRPDFTATFTRGVGRIIGTLLGLAVATVLIYLVPGDVVAHVLLIGILTFLIRSLGPANFGISAIAVTALVVFLLSLAGAPAGATIADRGRDTVIGGILALLAYAVWPTWERTQTPSILADMLGAYRAYFDAVMAGYLHPEDIDPGTLHTTRLACRLARSNVEASIERLRAEPRGAEEELDMVEGMLANSHRFVSAVMVLEAGLYRPAPATAPAVLSQFAADVDRTLEALGRKLRHPNQRLRNLPDVRHDQRVLTEAEAGEALDQAPGAGPPSVLCEETDRIVNSLNTMVHLLRDADDVEAAGGSSPVQVSAEGA